MPNSLTKRTALRDSLVPASCKPQYELIVKGSTNDTGFSAPAVTRTPPTAQVLFTESMGAARFFFAGVGSAGDTINYRIVAWVPLEPTSLSGGQTLVPIVIASGQLDLGSLVITTIVAGAKVVDTITDTIHRPGTVIWNPTDNTPASILVDVQNALILELETDLLSGATAAYAWGAPVDASFLSEEAEGEKLAATYKLAVTGTSGTIAARGGAALPEGTTSIMLKPTVSGTDTRFAMAGAASAATSRVPSTGVAIPITKADADALQLWTASASEVTLLVYVQRAS